MNLRLTSGFSTLCLLAAVAEGLILVATLFAWLALDSSFALFGAGLVVGLILLNVAVVGHHRNARRTRENLRRLKLLAEMNVDVNRDILLNEDIEIIYRTILDYLFSIFDKVTTGSILIVDGEGYLHFAASRGFTEDYVRNFRLKLEESFLYQDTNGHITEARLIDSKTIARLVTVFEPGDWEYRSVISAPLFIGDRLFGILNLDSSRVSVFDEADVRIVERFRAQIEVGLLAREHYRASIDRYRIDALTGLFSRRYFEDVFRITQERAVRYNESFVLALFDADRLKYINDTFGHLAGDRMLMAIASAIRSSCRKSDIVGRFGGDEFVAIYHATDPVTLDAAIATIRASLASRPTDLGETESVLSFSYGLASYPSDGRSLDELMHTADSRMYAMKARR